MTKGRLLEARIFELECMREKGLTAAEAAGIAADTTVESPDEQPLTAAAK